MLQAANRAGYRSAGYKPVASGSEMTTEGLRNGDALALQANSGVALRYDEVNPYVFAEPTSPHIVSADEGRPIEAARLSDGLRRLEQRADWVLVEGAGGWFTAVGAVHLRRLGAAGAAAGDPVVGIKLGCINHAVLTAQAVQQAG